MSRKEPAKHIGELNPDPAATLRNPSNEGPAHGSAAGVLVARDLVAAAGVPVTRGLVAAVGVAATRGLVAGGGMSGSTGSELPPINRSPMGCPSESTSNTEGSPARTGTGAPALLICTVGGGSITELASCCNASVRKVGSDTGKMHIRLELLMRTTPARSASRAALRDRDLGRGGDGGPLPVMRMAGAPFSTGAGGSGSVSTSRTVGATDEVADTADASDALDACRRSTGNDIAS